MARRPEDVTLDTTAFGIIVATAAYFINNALVVVLSDTLALLATTVVILWFAATLNSWLDRKFQFLPQGVAARRQSCSVGRWTLTFPEV